MWWGQCRAIMKLPALQHFSLVLNVALVGEPGILDILAPLKDLHLKDAWELKLLNYDPKASPIAAVLKETGFSCVVKQWR